jgi:DNA-directed RNA polymerase specialized sigma24 family protein
MWDWLVWAALAIAVIAGTAALVRLVVIALRAWRDLKRSRRALFKELDWLADAADAAAEKAAAAGPASDRLTRSLERLAVSRRKFAVLRSALDEATDAVRRVAAVYPRK